MTQPRRLASLSTACDAMGVKIVWPGRHLSNSRRTGAHFFRADHMPCARSRGDITAAISSTRLTISIAADPAQKPSSLSQNTR